MKKSKLKQLDKAVVNLYDNLTKAQGKRGEAFIRKKKEGLDLLKEAEKCYQLMHMLHEKADTQRTKIYTSTANSDVYRQTAKNVSDIVNKELAQLSSLYQNVVEKTVPKLMFNEDSRNSSQKYCEDTCRISEDSVYGSLSKSFQHELTLIIGKCMLQAETKITTLIVDSMVTRLNELAKHVEELNSHKGSTSAAPEAADKEEENEQEEEIDESIKQRRFTYTEKRKEIVRNDSPAPRSASVSSINKPKPSVPAKPGKRRSQDEDSVVSSDREALVPAKPSSEADSESIKSEDKVEVEIRPTPEEKPVIKEKPAAKEKPAVAERPAVTEVPVVVEKPEVAEKPAEELDTLEVTEKEVEPEKEAEPEKAPEPVVEAEPEKKVEPEKEPETEEVQPEKEAVPEASEDVEKPAEEAEKTEEDKEVPEPEQKPDEVDAAPELTNGETTSMDFNVMEDTAALTSITKSRVRGPKKKQRPTKSLAITTLDPFEVAAASDRNEQNGTPEPPTPEPEIKPKPKPKTYGKPMMPMMGMGAMNNELMNKLGGRKKASSPEPKAESSDPVAEPSEESPAPKKSPYRPPGARAMPGMGFGMGGGIGSELAGKLKSRNKAVESEDKPSESDDKAAPPVPKAKPKGGIALFPKPDSSRPRSPGSLGARKTPETPEKPNLRTKSWGKQS